MEDFRFVVEICWMRGEVILDQFRRNSGSDSAELGSDSRVHWISFGPSGDLGSDSGVTWAAIGISK